MARRYNRYAVPTGRVNVNRNVSNVTADARAKARTRSHVATSALRAKLAAVQIIQGDDSSWLHVVGDAIVARFTNVSDAVAAL
jgi:hypothetical protein